MPIKLIIFEGKPKFAHGIRAIIEVVQHTFTANIIAQPPFFKSLDSSVYSFQAASKRLQ